MQNVFEYGDVGDKFFIIIKGLVSIKIPNPTLKEWRLERKRFENLLEWKTEFLEPLMDAAIKDKFLKLRRQKRIESKTSLHHDPSEQNLFYNNPLFCQKLKIFGVKRDKSSKIIEVSKTF